MPSEVREQNTGTNIVFSKHNNAYADMWLLHGFSECSDSLSNIFESPLSTLFNIYIPNLPSFGKSSFEPEYLELANVIALLKKLIEKYSDNRPLILLGHSLGGTLATVLVKQLKNVIMFCNVEGMLLEDTCDARSLTKAKEFKDPSKFVEYMRLRLTGLAESNLYVKHYLTNILEADPKIIHAWALSSTEMLAGNKIDSLYKELTCRKIYIYGQNSIAKLELLHIVKADYDRIMIPEVGHWPMLEAPEIFWNVINRWIHSNITQPST